MFMTNTIEQEKVIPYWNEVKVLSSEEKYALITMLESSLSEEYIEENAKAIHGIPRDVMIAAAEYALKESRAGHCMPNSEVKSFIFQKRGWK